MGDVPERQSRTFDVRGENARSLVEVCTVKLQPVCPTARPPRRRVLDWYSMHFKLLQCPEARREEQGLTPPMEVSCRLEPKVMVNRASIS